jgi:acyl-CoA reductase-like NAD-dependent aldehyde dehydrogenase
MTEPSSTEPGALGPGHQKALEWLRKGPKRLYIGGEWVDAPLRQVLDTVNPATEESPCTRVAEADAGRTSTARLPPRAAHSKLRRGTAFRPHLRARLLLKIAEAIDRARRRTRRSGIARHVGVPLAFSTRSGRTSVAEALSLLRRVADQDAWHDQSDRRLPDSSTCFASRWACAP